MKRFELAKMTDKHMEQIKNGEELDSMDFSDDQWITIAMLIGAYRDEEVDSLYEWFTRDVRSYNE